ncbi:MAG TPA: amidohydrolase family protein [Pseudolysinimonas sp.]|nr:amidohydrolase family protein [Pseudolysinimonas sp.]
MKRIDIHAHVLPLEVMGKAGKYGPELIVGDDGFTSLRVGEYRSRSGGSGGFTEERHKPMHHADVRIAELDALGIDKMGVTISPLFYLYWAEDEIRVPFAAAQNDGLADYCAEDTSRLFWSATLPLPNVEASIAEVRRAVALGAKGINIGTGDFDGVDLDDKRLWPLYEEIERSGLPILLHPYPLVMADGAEDRYNLSWIVGYNYQETVAFAHLILGGVFDDFPQLRVVITHGGGAVPYQIGRIEEARKTQPGVRALKPVEEYRDNVYYELLLHDLRSRRFLVDFAGSDRLLVGDNFGGWDESNGFEMLEELGLPEKDRDLIAGGNAIRLFKL